MLEVVIRYFVENEVFDIIKVVSRSSRSQLYSTESNATYSCCENQITLYVLGLGCMFWVGPWFPIYKHIFVVFK